MTWKGHSFEIPFYVDGNEEMISLLSSRFSIPRLGRLVGSTKWATTIAYPQSLEGQSVFVLQPSVHYNPPRGWIERLFYSVGLGKFNTDQDIVISDVVKGYLKLTGH